MCIFTYVYSYSIYVSSMYIYIYKIGMLMCIFFRKSCALFYKKNPLKIVRGRAQYLYDHDGREYLDCINNVAHGMNISIRFDVCRKIFLPS